MKDLASFFKGRQSEPKSPDLKILIVSCFAFGYTVIAIVDKDYRSGYNNLSSATLVAYFGISCLKKPEES